MRFICSHDEHHRCHRLLSVLEFVHTLYAGLDVFLHVEALEDDKGSLVVHWKADPSEEHRTLFHVAWAHHEEPYDMVNHVVRRVEVEVP